MTDYKEEYIQPDFQIPEPKGGIQRFKDFFYNPEDGTCLRRTATSWAKILTFFVIYYAGLSVIFAICFQFLFFTISYDEPKLQLDKSVLGRNPGMIYRPLSEVTMENEYGSFIKYSLQNQTEHNYYIKQLDEFLAIFKDKGGVQCDFDSDIKSIGAKSCSVNIDNFGPCSSSNSYGYGQNPCFFLKLNKIFGWQPDCYSANDLPKDMPEDLVKYIEALPENQHNQIWISCKGKNPFDQKLIKNIVYHPNRGFPSYYYPYKKSAEYLSPLVAVQIMPAKNNHLISIECRAWAKNIIYSSSKYDPKGSASFQIYITNCPDEVAAEAATSTV